MTNYKVVFYSDNRGNKPVREFINAQDVSTRSKFAKLFRLLQIYGPQLMMPYAKYLKGGIYELRLRGKNEVRIFYVYVVHPESRIILLHAFKKRKQRLPEKELTIARKRQIELTRI